MGAARAGTRDLQGAHAARARPRAATPGVASALA